jgi:hypothetical protein
LNRRTTQRPDPGSGKASETMFSLRASVNFGSLEKRALHDTNISKLSVSNPSALQNCPQASAVSQSYVTTGLKDVYGSVVIVVSTQYGRGKGI